VTTGGLASYDADRTDIFRRTASYVDRVLRGEKPGDLPFQQPTKYQLTINLKSAKALGLTIPQGHPEQRTASVCHRRWHERARQPCSQLSAALERCA
jgi:ABC-type uncharacterized transport system substrate-binding protein